MILKPVGLIARGITARTSTAKVVLHPLYMPLNHVDTGWKLAHDQFLSGHFPGFTSPEDGEPYMRALAASVLRDALPFLQANGDLDGYLQWCRRINTGIPNGRGDAQILYREAATAIVLGRADEASGALEAIQAIATEDPMRREWLHELAEQASALHNQLVADLDATRKALLAGTIEQRRRRRLPLSDD